MKIAIVYNRESKNVVNLFGLPNQEKIGKQTIRRLADALRKGGHNVTALEGDKDLIPRLEEFMPRVVKGERPGMVFNVSYGIQGQARYTHVPSILEMIGVPYVASGPLAHSLSLDKVVTKMILRQHGLPTPDFAVLETPDAAIPKLTYPLIVKPKNEAVSFGLKIVHDEAELREGAAVIFDHFKQPVLVEQYIEGREVNVGILGNNPPEAFPPVELNFPEGGPRIYTYEDKTSRSERTITHTCPAPIGEELTRHAQEIAVKAFTALGCADCARVDMRLGNDGKLYILETNSLPSLGEHGSYLIGADHVGLDFTAFVNRLVEVASARYFGTPEPPAFESETVDAHTRIFSFVTQRRDLMERRVRDWTNLPSPTGDAIGVGEAARRAGRIASDIGLTEIDELADEHTVRGWQTKAGVDGGTLLIGHLDVPTNERVPAQQFRREPEWLFGEGIGSSRAPLVMAEFALRALKSLRRLQKTPLGLVLYTDEGNDARDSASAIRKLAGRADRVLVLHPGGLGATIAIQRRGQRKYRFRVVGEPRRPGRPGKKPDALRWTWNRLEAMSELSDRKRRVSVSAVDVRAERLPMLLPHRALATIWVTYPDAKTADETEAAMRATIPKGPRWELELLTDRPALVERRSSVQLAKTIEGIAREWEIPLKREASIWPSAAGLVPPPIPAVCGLGPVARNLGTPDESVQRLSLVQRTLVLASALATEDPAK